ncbi:hypothetical protein GW17_00061662 [Ensete ventricosum]|nr:hypothetical protein GW17_00061662 [Ensete ventricosum]
MHPLRFPNSGIRAKLAPVGVAPARCKVARGSPRPWLSPVGAALPAHEVPPEGSNACRRGDYPHRWRAAPPPTQGSGDDVGADGGKERARASF